MGFRYIYENAYNLLDSIRVWVVDFFDFLFTAQSVQIQGQVYSIVPGIWLLTTGIALFLIARIVLALNS